MSLAIIGGLRSDSGRWVWKAVIPEEAEHYYGQWVTAAKSDVYKEVKWFWWSVSGDNVAQTTLEKHHIQPQQKITEYNKPKTKSVPLKSATIPWSAAHSTASVDDMFQEYLASHPTPA